MVTEYVVQVNKDVFVPVRFRYLFNNKDVLKYGKYEVRFNYKQVGYERDFQEFIKQCKIGDNFTYKLRLCSES